MSSTNTLTVRLALAGASQVSSGLAHLGREVTDFGRKLNVAVGVAGAAAFGAFVAASSKAIRSGFDLNASLEDSRLRLAALQRSLRPDTFRTFDAAMRTAGDALDLLQSRAKESPASLNEMVEGFEAVTGAATAAGLSLEQQVDLVARLSGVLSSSELGALVSGQFGPGSRIAQVLRITREDIQNARQAGDLFGFLTQRLRGFDEAARAGQNTFRALGANIRDAFAVASAAATVPIFEAFKDAMKRVLETDWEAMGERIGDFVAAGIASWERGTFDRFVVVSLSAAFEEAVERLGGMLTKLFSLDGGVWQAIQRMLVRVGFAIRETLDDPYGITAWLAPDWAAARREALRRERDEAFRSMGIEGGVGTTYRDELRGLIDEMRADREARRGAAPGEPTALPSMTVTASMREPGMFDPNRLQETFTVALASIQQAWGTWALQLANVFKTTFDNAIASISTGISGLILQTKTWGQALREIGTSILTTVVQAIVQMGVRWVATRIVMATLGRAIAAKEAALTIGMNASLAASLSALWAAPAALATTATYGAAAAAAPGIISSSIAATKGLSVVTAVSGMAEGGLTPGRPTLRWVGEEGPEFVVNADATRRHRGILEAINSGATLRPTADSSSSPRPVNVHVLLDPAEWTRLQQDHIEGIFVDALRRHRV